MKQHNALLKNIPFFSMTFFPLLPLLYSSLTNRFSMENRVNFNLTKIHFLGERVPVKMANKLTECKE